MLLLAQIVFSACVVLVCAIFIGQIARKYIGYNPTAPSAFGRLWRWLIALDAHPELDESHAETRYRIMDDVERGGYDGRR